MVSYFGSRGGEVAIRFYNRMGGGYFKPGWPGKVVRLGAFAVTKRERLCTHLSFGGCSRVNPQGISKADFEVGALGGGAILQQYQLLECTNPELRTIES